MSNYNNERLVELEAEVERLRGLLNDRENLAIANARLWEELRLSGGRYHPGYLIGVHWMTAAYGRICAGEDEAEVIRDYGYARAPVQPDDEATCADCGALLELVRPGKWQHIGECRAVQPKDAICKCDDHDARYCVNRIGRGNPCRCACHGASDTAAHCGAVTTTGTQPTSQTSADAQPSGGER